MGNNESFLLKQQMEITRRDVMKKKEWKKVNMKKFKIGNVEG